MPLNYPRRSPAFLKARVAVRPFVSGQHVVVGLSGGADSLTLLAAALAEGAKAHAVVVDHQLQPGSAAVAEQAAAIASGWGAEATIIPVTVAGEGGMEAAARRARYEALCSFGKPVWTGHTMDDQAETFLLGALRGNPTGMLARSTMNGVNLVRPLLQIRRGDTETAMQELGVTPWSDPHNAIRSYRRVAVRADIIPQLDQLVGGASVPALAQAAARAALAQDAIAAMANPEASVSELRQLPPAVRQESIAQLIHGEVDSVSYAAVAAVEDMVCNWHGQGPVAIGGSAQGRVWITKVGDRLEVRRDSTI